MTKCKCKCSTTPAVRVEAKATNVVFRARFCWTLKGYCLNSSPDLFVDGPVSCCTCWLDGEGVDWVRVDHRVLSRAAEDGLQGGGWHVAGGDAGIGRVPPLHHPVWDAHAPHVGGETPWQGQPGQTHTSSQSLNTLTQCLPHCPCISDVHKNFTFLPFDSLYRFLLSYSTFKVKYTCVCVCVG